MRFLHQPYMTSEASINYPIERHPFEPFMPEGARMLMLGTFPPDPKRWCMPWYYPNFANDMWRIFGIVFFNDKLHFVDEVRKTYRLDELKRFLTQKGVAIFDTALRIRRGRGTASDRDLEIIEQADLDAMLRRLPNCKAVLTAGLLATSVFAGHFGIDVKHMKMGSSVVFEFEGRPLRLYRMPSSSRAYPMAVERKAEYYRAMFDEIGL